MFGKTQFNYLQIFLPKRALIINDGADHPPKKSLIINDGRLEFADFLLTPLPDVVTSISV